MIKSQRTMDQQRIILLVVFGFSLIMLWEGWQKFQQPKVPVPAVAAQSVPAGSTPGNAQVGAAVAPTPTPTPSPSGTLTAAPSSNPATATTGGAAVPQVPGAQGMAQGEKVVVRTDTMVAEVSALGGSIVHLEFLKHKATADDTHNFVLFDASQPHIYMAESGLIGEGLPNHTTQDSVEPGASALKDGEDSVQVRLRAPEKNGVEVTKVLTFRRGSYVIDVGYEIANRGEAPLGTMAYFQLMRDGKAAESSSGAAQTFTGAALYT
ncbi:MAG: membrane protein insertase YidC, partial [Rhodocyclaceae bacterium]